MLSFSRGSGQNLYHEALTAGYGPGGSSHYGYGRTKPSPVQQASVDLVKDFDRRVLEWLDGGRRLAS
jgi:hypothetical protein